MRVQIIDHILIECTCPACPEQYNFYISDTLHHDCWVRVGYFRARGGIWSLHAPGIWGEALATGQLENFLAGQLADDKRQELLEDCVKKIWAWLKKHPIEASKPFYEQLAAIEDKDLEEMRKLWNASSPES